MKHKNKIFLFPLIMFMAASCIGPIGSQTVSAGVAKTTNGGADWTLSNTVVTTTEKGKKTTTKTSEDLLGTDVQVLQFSPASSEHLVAGTNAGVYVSDNSGDSWRQILAKTEVNAIAIDAANSEHIYVAGLVAGNGKVLESKNGGKSWEEIYNEVSPDNAVQALVINPDNARELVIGMASGNVIKSADGGRSWTLLQNF